MTLLTESTYQSSVSKGVSLVDIYADWCNPCRQISPIVEELANEATDYSVYKMDADTNPNIMKSMNVRSIPTILVYKDGVVVDRHVGMANKDQLNTLAKKYL